MFESDSLWVVVVVGDKRSSEAHTMVAVVNEEEVAALVECMFDWVCGYEANCFRLNAGLFG